MSRRSASFGKLSFDGGIVHHGKELEESTQEHRAALNLEEIKHWGGQHGESTRSYWTVKVLCISIWRNVQVGKEGDATPFTDVTVDNISKALINVDTK